MDMALNSLRWTEDNLDNLLVFLILMNLKPTSQWLGGISILWSKQNKFINWKLNISRGMCHTLLSPVKNSPRKLCLKSFQNWISNSTKKGDNYHQGTCWVDKFLPDSFTSYIDFVSWVHELNYRHVVTPLLV